MRAVVQTIATLLYHASFLLSARASLAAACFSLRILPASECICIVARCCTDACTGWNVLGERCLARETQWKGFSHGRCWLQ